VCWCLQKKSECIVYLYLGYQHYPLEFISCNVYDTQHDDIQHNNTDIKDLYVTLSITDTQH